MSGDYFERSLEKMDLCTLRFLHYPPPCDASRRRTGRAPRSALAGARLDFGAFTRAPAARSASPPMGIQIAGAEVGGAADARRAAGSTTRRRAPMARWRRDRQHERR